jgi:proteasome lid subunit RPN8/RPN11
MRTVVIIPYRLSSGFIYLTKHSLAGTREMKVSIRKDALEPMLEIAREQHPHEVIFLLRGKVSRGDILIEDFLLPPFASAGVSFAQFPLHMLPIDLTIVGTAHSHPSGSRRPSTMDLNHFYSRMMIILAYPYQETNIGAFNSRGEDLNITVTN